MFITINLHAYLSKYILYQITELKLGNQNFGEVGSRSLVDGFGLQRVSRFGQQKSPRKFILQNAVWT